MPRYPTPLATVDPALEAIARDAQRASRSRDDDAASGDPYRAQHGVGYTYVSDAVAVHSFFRDLLVVAEAEARVNASMAQALEHGGRGGRDPGFEPPPGFPADTVEAARERIAKGIKRDLSSSNAGDVLRPSSPGFIGEMFGRASRATGKLIDAIGAEPLEEGMVDTSSGVPILSIPRFASGAATAVQASQNAAVQETDPTTGAMTSPVATIAGLVDMSAQLFEFSRPGMDVAIADDLGRDWGAKADVQIVNGSAGSGQTRGLLNVASILSVAGTVTTAATFLESVWKAYSALAGSSGIGNPAPDDYLTILHPRRYAWTRGNTTGIQGDELFPGTVVASAGVPSNLGAGTNEDIALIVERSNLVLAVRRPAFKVDESTGSSTLTVRTLAYGMLSLVAKNPGGIAKVTGLTPPTGF